MRVLFAGPDTELVMTNSGEDRQPGVHLSDILVRIAWEKDKKYHPDAPKDYMVFEQGHTWETVLSRALSARNERPGYRPEQIQEDGVWLSPDWVNEDADVQAEEWKSTRKSSKNLEQKIEEWIPQGQCYLRALLRRGLAKVPIMRWRVWCVMGDWSFESKGDLTLLRDYYRVDIEFTKRELEERWRSVVAAGKKYGLLQDKKLSGGTRTRGQGVSVKMHASNRGSAPISEQEQERTWRRPRLEATIARRQKAGSQPASAHRKGRLLMYRTTKPSPKPRAGS